MASPQITFRLTESLAEMVGDRAGKGNLTATAKRDLERYYSLIAEATPTFEAREAALLYDAVSTFSDDVAAIRYVWADVVEKMDSRQLAQKWGVDSDRLIQRLRSLSICERFALVDAVERALIKCDALDVGTEPAAWGALTSVGLAPRSARRPQPASGSSETDHG